MIALKTIDMRNDFKRVSEIIKNGEKVLIARPHNDNLVVLSEKEYNKLEKVWRNAEYLNKIEMGIKELEQGKGITLKVEDLEAMETQSGEEAKAYLEKIKNAQECRPQSATGKGRE